MQQLSALILVPVLAATLVGAVSAQEIEASADTTVADEITTDLMRARELLGTLATELDSLRSIQVQAQSTEDEKFRLLLVSGQRHLDIVDDIQPELMKLLPKLDPGDPGTAEIRKDASDFLMDKFDIYDKSLLWRNREIDILREQRASTPPEELGDLETRIGKARERLDSLLADLKNIIQEAESLGVDTTNAWQRFDRATNTRADNLVGRLQISVDNRENLKKKIETSEKAKAPEAEIGALRTSLQISETQVKGVAKSLSATVDLMGSRGFETAPYQQFIIRTTGEISEKVLDPRVLFGLVRDGLKDGGGWLWTNGPVILVKLMIVIAVIIIFHLLFRVIWWLMRLVRIFRLTRLMTQLGNSIINPLATTFGLLAGLWFIGVDPTTLLTGAGVAGVIIGLALQDSLANMAAGVHILATRPFDIDDVICTGSVVGTVKAMWIANTTVVTFDGRRLLIPNRKIWADTIENRSIEPLRRAEITVRVGFEEDIERAISILHDLVKEEERVLDNPKPSIFTLAWAEFWVEIAVWPWVRNEDWWPLLQDLPLLVVQRFAEEGIEIPYPYRELKGGGLIPPPPERGADQI